MPPSPTATDFPPSDGKTLQELADTMAAGPDLALASSVFTTGGDSRMAFGMINKDGTPVYGPTAVYVAPTPDAPAEGPFLAPADVLLTDARFRSKQAATTQDPFVAVYGADVDFPKRGPYSVLAATKKSDGALTGATGNITVSTADADPIPAVGEKAPVVHTDTLATVKGDEAMLDTRQPPSDMHEVDFAEVVGKEPVALLFATPQLCASRVCGPVADIALQMKAKYGDRMKFIHQEVLGRQRHHQGPARAAQAVQPADGAVAVRGRPDRQDHRAARGFDRRRAVRGSRQVRAVRRALAVLAAALAAGALVPAVASAHGLVQRQQLPIPQWLFAWAAAAVLVISFFALALLWQKPKLEDGSWRALPGGRVLASGAGPGAVRRRSASGC